MLIREMNGDVLVLRLNNPARLNAWSQATRFEIEKTLAVAATDGDIKAVVLTGSGERAFCAGQDLTDPAMGDPDAAESRMKAFHDFYRALLSFPKPLVAALNGLTAGSAFQAILLMDSRVGHDGVRLGMPEINSGIPCITGSTILKWAVGSIMARSIVTTGRYISAQESLQFGLIDELVPAGEVQRRAVEVANALAAKAPEAFAETKFWVRDQILPELAAAFERATQVRAKEAIAHNVRAGIGQFFARTEPGDTK